MTDFSEILVIGDYSELNDTFQLLLKEFYPNCSFVYTSSDLRYPVKQSKKYDLILCLEVAEHLPIFRLHISRILILLTQELWVFLII